MNLTITQDNTRTETINSSIIDKLYEIAFAASSNPNSTVSLIGRLESLKGYKYKIDWLNTEFSPNLTITVPAAGQYMTFTDSALENALKTTIGDGDGVFLEQLKSTNPDVNLGLNNNTNIVDARELCLIEGTSQSGDLFLRGCSNIKTIGIPCNLTYYRFLPAVTVDNIVVKNLTNYINANWANNNYSFYRNSSGWDLYITTDGSNITKVENLTIPSDAVFSNSITQIPFYKCKSVKNVTVPSGITSLRGFNGSNIQSVTFEQNSALTSILNDCFYECSNLVFDVANLPQTITTIGSDAFRNCSNVTGVLDLHNLTSLGQSSFNGTGITGATDLGSITEIPQCCFQYSTLQSITLPSTCTTIGGSAFYGCSSLTTVTLSNSCKQIDSGAFRYCRSLTNINLSNIVSIGYRAFEETPLTTVNLSSLKVYGQECFHSCGNISITIPLESPSQYNNAFTGNTRLLNIQGSVENWESVSRLFPFFANSSTGIDVLHYKNAASIGPYSDDGLCTTVSQNVGIKSMYIPKLQEISCDYSATYHRISSIFSSSVQGHFVSNDILKIDLLYFKNLSEIISSPFGGLTCRALVINNSIPPTITPQTYTNINEFRISVDNVKVNAWGEIEDATDPNATITGTTTYGWDYNQTKKLFHTPNITNIYVPDGVVNTYKTTTGWTSVANLIQPISSLNSGVVYATQQDWETAGKPVGLIAECLDLSTADLATFVSANNLTYWTNPNS